MVLDEGEKVRTQTMDAPLACGFHGPEAYSRSETSERLAVSHCKPEGYLFRSPLHLVVCCGPKHLWLERENLERSAPWRISLRVRVAR